ncbi:MAG: hypothetical protein IPO07_27275 [Haliscomenobacter sp.]|nr:hypothetical protein [Haliscomenobacter sp.]MBK9492090.1 hypothetical protein [Haliscomenobacter sp.]
MPVKLWIYNIGSNKGLGKWLRNKYGEAPVLLSDVNLGLNVEILDNYMENRGFFHVKVRSDTTVTRKKASAEYEIFTGPEYKIRNITFPTDTSALANAIRETQPKTLLRSGAPFNLDLIKGERTRIDVELKEKGFYYFSGDYLLLETDTTIGNNEVNLYMQIKWETPAEAKLTYRINDVFIYSNYNLSTARQDTALANAEFQHGYYVIDTAKLYKPIVFNKVCSFNPATFTAEKTTIPR